MLAGEIRHDSESFWLAMLSCLELYVTGQSLVGTTLGISESRSYHIIRWIRKWCNLVKEQPQTDGRRLKTLIETPKTPHRDVASPFFWWGGGSCRAPRDSSYCSSGSRPSLGEPGVERNLFAEIEEVGAESDAGMFPPLHVGVWKPPSAVQAMQAMQAMRGLNVSEDRNALRQACKVASNRASVRDESRVSRRRPALITSPHLASCRNHPHPYSCEVCEIMFEYR